MAARGSRSNSRKINDQGTAVPGHRRSWNHRLNHRGSARGGRRGRGDGAGQFRPRPTGKPPSTRLPRACVRVIEGDIRDRSLVRLLMAGIDLVFHQAAIRITQCATEPRLALEVLVDGTYEVVEAAAEAGVRKVVAASSASVYGLAEEFPTSETAPSIRQRHPVRGGQDLQRGPAPQLPRDARPGLRRAPILQRLRPADGYTRPVHRGPDQVDGADRGGTAAAHPWRRYADDGFRLHRRYRPR